MINHPYQQVPLASHYVGYDPFNRQEITRNNVSFFTQTPNYSLNMPYPSLPNPFYGYFPQQQVLQVPCFPIEQPALGLNCSIEKKVAPSKVQIVELAHQGNIKVEFIQEEKEKKYVPKRYTEQNLVGDVKVENSQKKQNWKTLGMCEVRSEKLQRVFKQLLKNLIEELPNYETCREKFLEDLDQIQEFQVRRQFSLEFYEALKIKFQQFKKTKEELVKYIIRRTYHNAKNRKNLSQKIEFERLEAFHERNLKLYKSMNHDFLRKQFSNPLFLQEYQEYLDQLDEQIEKENEERVDRLATALTSAWLQENLQAVEFQKKLPWIHVFQLKIKVLARELLNNHKICEGTRHIRKNE